MIVGVPAIDSSGSIQILVFDANPERLDDLFALVWQAIKELKRAVTMSIVDHEAFHSCHLLRCPVIDRHLTH